MDLGNLVDQLEAKFPALVSRNAKVLRKAVAHRHWRYVANRDAIEYWNETRAHKIIERRTVSVDALARWCARLLYVSTVVVRNTRESALADMLVDAGMLRTMLLAVAEYPSPSRELTDVVGAAMAKAMGIGPPLPACAESAASDT